MGQGYTEGQEFKSYLTNCLANLILIYKQPQSRMLCAAKSVEPNKAIELKIETLQIEALHMKKLAKYTV